MPETRPKKEKKKKTTHLTMMVVPNSHGTSVKSYCLPVWAVKSFLVVSITCILIVTYFVSGYFYLQYIADENKELKKVNMAQAKEISELKGLAGTMREKLEALMKLDQEVRAKIGLTNNTENKNNRTVGSSRAAQYYPYTTMALVQSIGQGQEPMIPYAVQNLATTTDTPIEQMDNPVDQSNDQANDNSSAMIMELPAPDGEIDTLEELKEQLAQMDQVLTQQTDVMNKLKTDVDKQIAYQNALPSSWPLSGRLTSGFGWRKNPYSHRGSEFHEGIDLATTYGTPIRAASDGVVTFAGYKGSWGRMILISHGFGFVTQYAHNSSLLVKAGEKVKRGQIIARLGSTGRSTGPHLHFGIAKDSKWVNPLQYLKR